MVEQPCRIVFFDGECGFCNRTVQFVLKNDKTQSIHFARIQSEFTRRLFSEMNLPQPDLSTFYFMENKQMFEKSTAALKLCKYLRFPHSLLQFLWIVPRVLRDKGYDSVACRRQRLMKGFCVIPSDQEEKRFIDEAS